MDLDVDTFLGLLKALPAREREDRAYQQWCAMLPYMSMQMIEYVSFDEYLGRQTGQNIDMRPRDEIIKEIEELHKRGGETA